MLTDQKPYGYVPPEREGQYHRPDSSFDGYRSEAAGWVAVYTQYQLSAATEPLLARIAELEKDVAHKDAYAEQLGRELSNATRELEEARKDAIKWPKARDVGRFGDMSPSAHMRVGLDSDNDVYVSIWGDEGGGSVEFCNGGGGGGSSMKTRLALIALMVAMEEDNAARPDKDWWARRMSGAAIKEQT